MKRYDTMMGVVSFGVAVGALILFLKLMNWIPFTVQKNTLREFNSLEEVKSALQIRDIFIPSYFPQGIRWPPSKILAQDKPFPALLMEFMSTGKEEVVLILTQTRGGTTLKSLNSFEPSIIKETVQFQMHDNTAVLTVGECPKKETCSMITWSEGGYTIKAFMKSTPVELAKIASSMHP